ncbi:hypothetical protein VPH46_13075 [Sphingomonas sp. MJ1 (PH-R8)]|uniref:hypothetical protein n=1 Tax=Sphingomonas sp. MJ1 (PH-R8) TaxID=3112950 RepID=UPI003A8AC409
MDPGIRWGDERRRPGAAERAIADIPKELMLLQHQTVGNVMGEIPKTKRYTAYVSLWVGIFLALPLWLEFREPARQGWNFFLAAFVVALIAGTFLGIRRLQKGHVEVGEPRFRSGQRD